MNRSRFFDKSDSILKEVFFRWTTKIKIQGFRPSEQGRDTCSAFRLQLGIRGGSDEWPARTGF